MTQKEKKAVAKSFHAEDWCWLCGHPQFLLLLKDENTEQEQLEALGESLLFERAGFNF